MHPELASSSALLGGLDLFFGEFSVKFPDEFSVKKGKPSVVVRRIKKSSNFHDPWVGTDTTGPGEAVSAIGGANLEGIT